MAKRGTKDILSPDVIEWEWMEEKYRTIVRTAFDGFWITDLGGRLLEVNDSYCKMIGYTREELLTMSIPDIEAAENPEAMAQHIKNTMEQGYDRFETRHRRKGGKIIDVEISVNYLDVAGGQMFVFVRDITERKQMEEALTDEAVRRRILIEQSRDGIVVLDQNGRVYESNQRFAVMLGYSPEEVLQLHVWDWEFQFTREQVIEMIRSVDETGDHFETQHRRKDGTIYDVEISTNGTVFAGEKMIFCVCRDITKRKNAEEALRKSEEKLRRMFEVVSDGVVVTDLNGVIVDVNDRLLEMHGFSSRDEILSRHVLELVAPFDREKTMVNDQKALEKGFVRSIEASLLKVDGSVFLCELNMNLLKDASGNPVGFITTGRDITERKQAEKALKESEEKFRTFMETASDLMLIADKYGNITYVNEAMARTLGYSKEEMIGMHITQLLSKEALGKDFKPNWDKFITNGEVTLDTTFATNDGKDIYGELKAVGVYGNDGKYAGSRAVFRDLTERKNMEQALADEAIRRRILVEQSRDGIVVLDENGGVFEANRRFAQMLGYSPEEMLELHMWDWDTQWTKEQLLEMVRSVDAAGDHFETYHSRKDGTIYDVEISTNGAIIAGQKLIFCICRDLTERKKAQRELQAKNEQLDVQNEELQSQSEELITQQQELMQKTRELEAASRAKSDFLSSMSHELRTPLNAVIGFSELMLDGIPGEINDEQKQCLSDIWNSGQHLLNLINDILDLSKVEAGKMELKLGNLSLVDAIEDIARTVKPMLDENRHKLAVSIEKGLPQVRADKSRLRQIFLNLLSNAIKFTPLGGVLAIDASREGDWCQVSVADNGIGISQEDQERIFEAFIQAEALPDGKKEGTGLGLAITKRFVEVIGGRIWLESQYGKGSKFTFTLPLVREGKPSLEREGSKSGWLG